MCKRLQWQREQHQSARGVRVRGEVIQTLQSYRFTENLFVRDFGDELTSTSEVAEKQL